MLEQTTREAILAVRDRAAANGITATLTLHREHSHLMRIGNNAVSLNTTEALSRLDVEVTDGRRQGSHTLMGAIDSVTTVEECLEAAVVKARFAMPLDYDPIPDVVEAQFEQTDQFDRALADLEPAAKAEAYRDVMGAIGDLYNFSGSWSSGVTERYLVTTANRNEAWRSGTDQLFSLVLKHPVKRWELEHRQTGWRLSDHNAALTTEHMAALLPTFEDRPATSVTPGAYTVLFGSEALADIVGMAAFSGLAGRSWEEKAGWTARNEPGDQILGSNISIADDPTCEATFKHVFDGSGRSRQAFPLVDQGRLVQLMYDSGTAAKYGRKPTGHNIGSTSLVLAPGTGPGDALAAAKGRGRVLYIPALHYTHLPNRSKGVFTGSSRFSAVLVEDGTVVGPIYSTRITDSFQNVLGNVVALAPWTASVNQSSTYGRRSPVASNVPGYALVEGVKITDSADSF